VRSWKSSPEFKQRIAHVMQYVDDFHPTELDVVVTVNQGARAVALSASTTN
jgi:hypothetical protein